MNLWTDPGWVKMCLCFNLKQLQAELRAAGGLLPPRSEPEPLQTSALRSPTAERCEREKRERRVNSLPGGKLKGGWTVLHFRKRSHRIWLLDSQKRQRVKCRDDSEEKQQRFSRELLLQVYDITAAAASTHAAGPTERRPEKDSYSMNLSEDDDFRAGFNELWI